MELAYGSHVFGSDGDELGVLKELVIEPRSRVVTHLVVQSGLLFSADQLVPADLVVASGNDGIRLSVSADAAAEQHATDYEQSNFVALEDDALAELGGTGTSVWARPSQVGTADAPYPSLIPPGIGPIAADPEVVVPLDEIVLEEGSPVRASDGTKIGTIDECMMDADEKITHILIREGTVFSVPKLIPIDWIARIDDNEVVLAVSVQTVDRLPEP